MKCKTFNYKKYKNCTFYVGSYRNDPDCIYIEILDKNGEPIIDCTIFMNGYLYDLATTTIKNYSEGSGMTKFLKKLGIIEDIYTRRKANPLATKSETIDFCKINVKTLEQYSSEFNYKYENE